MLTKRQVNQTLEKAALIIEAGGFCKGRLRTASGKHCIIGACLVALNEKMHCVNWPDPEIMRELQTRINKVAFSDEKSITGWNDQKKRTAKEVINLLRGATG